MPRTLDELIQLRPKPGTVTRTRFRALEHPAGHAESLPVVIIQGRTRGPTLVLTATLHGDEVTGMHVLHDTLDARLAQRLHGTVIAIPCLNPTGLDALQRQPTFDARDPNRLFPDPRPKRAQPADKPRRRVDALAAEPAATRAETVMHGIYRLIRYRADAYLDLHCASTWSIPITIVDPVFYNKQRERGPAHALLERTMALARAIGVTIVREEPPPRYFDRRMHRSSTGSVLNGARIPAVTLELGMSRAVDPVGHRTGVRAVRNAMRHLGLLREPPEPQEDVPVLSQTGRMRGIDHPRAPVAGVVRYHVRPGQVVRKGERIATIRRLDGRTVPKGILRAEMDGAVLWLRGEGTTYPGSSIALFGVEDDLPLVLPWPDR